MIDFTRPVFRYSAKTLHALTTTVGRGEGFLHAAAGLGEMTDNGRPGYDSQLAPSLGTWFHQGEQSRGENEVTIHNTGNILLYPDRGMGFTVEDILGACEDADTDAYDGVLFHYEDERMNGRGDLVIFRGSTNRKGRAIRALRYVESVYGDNYGFPQDDDALGEMPHSVRCLRAIVAEIAGVQG